MHKKTYGKFFFLGLLSIVMELINPLVYEILSNYYEIEDFNGFVHYTNYGNIASALSILILLGVVIFLIPRLFSSDEKYEISSNKYNIFKLYSIFILPLFLFIMVLYSQYDYFRELSIIMNPDNYEPTFLQQFLYSLINFPSSFALSFSMMTDTYEGLTLEILIVELFGSIYRNLKYFFPYLYFITLQSPKSTEDQIDLYKDVE